MTMVVGIKFTRYFITLLIFWTAVLSPLVFGEDSILRPILEKIQSSQANDDSLSAMANLNAEILSGRPNIGALDLYFGIANDNLKGLKIALEQASQYYSPRDPYTLSYIAFVRNYDDYLSELYAAAELMSNLSHKNLESKRAQINDLSLVLSCKAAGFFARADRQKVTQKGDEPFDGTIQVKQIDAGHCLVLKTQREIGFYTLGGFLAFPEKEAAIKTLKNQSFKILFSERATLDSYLYPEERRDLKLVVRSGYLDRLFRGSSEAATADRSLVAMQNFASSFQAEGTYRARLGKDLDGRITKPFVEMMDRLDSIYVDRLKSFLKRMGEKYKSHIDKDRIEKVVAVYKLLYKDQQAIDPVSQVSDFIINGQFDKLYEGFWYQEKYNREGIIRGELLGGGAYLTQLSREELSRLVITAFQLGRADKIWEVLRVGFFDLSPECESHCFSQNELQDLHEEVDFFAGKTVSDEVIERAGEKQAFANAINVLWKDIKNVDLAIAYRRYNLSDRVIKVVRGYEEDSLKIVALAQEKEAEKGLFAKPFSVEAWLPSDPDPSLVFEVLNFEGHAPPWYVEMLQLNLADLNQVESLNQLLHDAKLKPKKKSSESEKVFNVMVSVPDDFMHTAQALEDDLKWPGAIAAIQAAHMESNDFGNYRWNNSTLKMQKLLDRVHHQGAKAILIDLNALAMRAEDLQAGILLSEANAIFRNIINNDEYVSLGNTFKKSAMSHSNWGFDELKSDLTQAIQFKKKAFGFIEAMFAPKAKRIDDLRGMLRDVDLLLEYYKRHQRLVETGLPGLFLAIDLPPDVVHQSMGIMGSDFGYPVTIYNMVRWLIGEQCERCSLGAIRDRIPAEPFIRGAFEKMSKMNDLYTPERLRSTIFDDVYDLHDLLRSASMGKADEWQGLRGPIERAVDFGIAQNKGPSKEAQGVEGEFWPQSLRIRDFIPAFENYKDAKKHLSAGELEGRLQFIARALTERVIVAAVLGPYLRSAAAANTDGTLKLLDPSSDYLKIQVQSRAYKQLVKAAPVAEDLLEEIKDDNTKASRFFTTMKEVTRRGQHIAYPYLFFPSVFLPLPGVVQTGIFYYMVGSNFADLIVDAGLWLDSRSTYNMALPFAQSGAVGGDGRLGFMDHNDFSSIGLRYREQSLALANRVPWDAWFAASTIGYARAVSKSKHGEFSGRMPSW